MTTAQTALTQYIKAANGTTFAYRRLGINISTAIPLIMHIHFRANMDFWDPLLVNTLAARRPVIIFDQAGVGRSTGTIPTNYQGWADDLIAFVTALGLKEIDLFGFSMGGRAVQMVALTAPRLVRKLVLAGTSPSMPIIKHGGSGQFEGIIWPRDQAPTRPIQLLASATSQSEIKEALAVSFFYETEAGRAAFNAYWTRLHQRNVSSEPLLLTFVDAEGSRSQRLASREWDEPNPQNSGGRLGELSMPVLVANGDDDVLIPTSRSWELLKGIEGAKLVIYPKAGHGFLWQLTEEFAREIGRFLDGDDEKKLNAKF